MKMMMMMIMMKIYCINMTTTIVSTGNAYRHKRQTAATIHFCKYRHTNGHKRESIG